MRKKIVAGNWKMNTTLSSGTTLVESVLSQIENVDLSTNMVVFGVPFVSLNEVANRTNKLEHVYTAAQNISQHQSGAYTGEVSAEMVQSTGAKMAIIGHSERRAYFNETNQILVDKVNLALAHGLMPIYCCGEELAQRKDGTFKSVIESQVTEGLFHLSEAEIREVVIAYEPVWAIGTGETASPEQAQEVHAFIREIIATKYGREIANEMSILYGGSMKPGNAKELMDMTDIDGGLVGGASLNATDFVQIIQSM